LGSGTFPFWVFIMAELTEFNVGQGETFRIAATIIGDSGSIPLNITNYTFSGQVRENYTTDEVAATFTITKLPPFNSGSVMVELTPDQTLALTQRKYVYDVNMVSGSVTPIKRRILEGALTIRPTATR
jgi:hypothetical protein